MRLLILFAILSALLSGCATVQHADKQAGYSYRTEIRQRNRTARENQASSDAVRLAAVQGASTVTVTARPPEDNQSSPCPDLDKQEAEFKELCSDYTEGSGDVNTDREAVCVPLRAALDQLRDSCTSGGSEEQTEVIFTPPTLSSAGVNINLTGASTGDIRLIIQSPGAADQSSNGVRAEPPPPASSESVITGMTNGLLDLLGKATPWAISGYALGEFADAFSDGLRNAGDRDNSVDESVTIDKSIGGNKISLPAEE